MVLGLGVATLTAQGGAVAMAVADVAGVDIAGVMFDAGTVNSPVLLQVGSKRRQQTAKARATSMPVRQPTTLQDVFFRIGGRPRWARPRSAWKSTATTCSWTTSGPGVPITARASAGTLNTADTGVVINGDNVTATGLFVEHYQKYNAIWNGENGKTVFFQNELPYDAPEPGRLEARQRRWATPPTRSPTR